MRHDGDTWLGVICDGMSGYRDNAAAARAAAAAFAEQWGPLLDPDEVTPWMDEALIRAQSAVLDSGARAGLSPGVTGTTLLAAASVQERLWWISVGDTSLFLLRDGLFELLNVLHTREGERSAPRSYLGAPELLEIDRSPSPLRLRDGDILLLASDGLTSALDTNAIGELLRHDPGIHAQDLIGQVLAMDCPAQDNLTIILMRAFE